MLQKTFYPRNYYGKWQTINAYDLDEDYDDLKTAFKEARSSKEIRETIGMFCDEFPNDMVSLFIAKAGGLSV